MKSKPVSTADFDLRLLDTFNEVYKYSSVSKAAKALHCSPSFVSQTMQKLRVFFSDPLFVRNGMKLKPTTMARTIHLQLSQQYGDVLSTLESLVNATSKNLLVVHCSSYFAIRIVPLIVEWAQTHAPECKIVHRDFLYEEETSEDLLLLRDVDLVFDMLPSVNRSLCTVPVAKEEIVMICREGHPRLGSHISAEEAKHEQFAILTTGSMGSDLQLEQNTVESHFGERSVRYTSFSLSSITAVVARTDMLGIIPTWLYEQSRAIYPIRKLNIDFSFNAIPFYMMYSKVALQNDIFSELVTWLEKDFSTQSQLAKSNFQL